MKYKVLLPENISDKGLIYLEMHDCETLVLDDASVENVCAHVTDCDAILVRNSELSREVFECAKKMKVIARHGVGVERIDLETAKEHGVIVTTTPGANSDAVAEHTIALIMACAKNIPFFHDKTKEGDWVLRDTMKTVEVSKKTLGLIGYGQISRLVAKKAALGLDMKVLVYRTHKEEKLPDYIQEVECMEDIFKTSDFVSFHMPLREDTKGVVNQKMIHLMKPNAYFINTARGGCVDHDALYEALKNHKIAGAALDVFEVEPPDIKEPLFALDNVILSPHNAAHTVEAMDNMAVIAAENIVRILQEK